MAESRAGTEPEKGGERAGTARSAGGSPPSGRFKTLASGQDKARAGTPPREGSGVAPIVPVSQEPPPANAYGSGGAEPPPVAEKKKGSSGVSPVITPAPAAQEETQKRKEPFPRLMCPRCEVTYSGALPFDRKCIDCGTPLVEADPGPGPPSTKLRPADPGAATTTSPAPPPGSPLLFAPGTSRKPELIVTRYLIKDPQADMLGSGAKGVVYRARDRRMGDRPVAIKLFYEGGVEMPGAQDTESLREKRRVEREIKIQAALTHPAIVTAHDRFDTPHGAGIVLEFIDGESLEDRVRRQGPLPVREAVRLTIETARAVEFMHGRKIIHRDMKPSNVLITRDGNVKIIDFGVAKAKADAALEGDDGGKAGAGNYTVDERDPLTNAWLMTTDGTIVGTPSYMSPEQAHGRISFVDERSDIYGIGAILYYAVTAHAPFGGDDIETILERVRKVPPPRPSKWNHRVDLALEAIVLRSMRKVPEQRFSSAGVFADQLQRYLDGETLDPTVYREPLHRRAARAFVEHRTGVAIGAIVALSCALIFLAFDVAGRMHRADDYKKRLEEAGRALGDLDAKRAHDLYDSLIRDDPGNQAAKEGYLAAVRALIHTQAFEEGKHRLEEARKARFATPDQAEKLYDLALFRLLDAKRMKSPRKDLDALIAEARGVAQLEVAKPTAFIGGDAVLRLIPLTSELSEPLNREQWPDVPLPAKEIRVEVGMYQAQIRPAKGGKEQEPLLFPIRIARGADVTVEPIPAALPGMVYIRGHPSFRPGHAHHDDLPPGEVAPFVIDRREVTVGEYRQFLDSFKVPIERVRHLPAHWPRGGGSCPDPDDFPISNISFEDAKLYARFRGKELPTEAQWQLAASGGLDDRDYPWGMHFVATCTNCATGAPVRAGQNPLDRSPFGVLDMGGNVSEYVDGFFDTKGRVRLAKGGSFLKKSPVWERLPVEGPDRTIGFRCVRAILPPPPR